MTGASALINLPAASNAAHHAKLTTGGSAASPVDSEAQPLAQPPGLAAFAALLAAGGDAAGDVGRGGVTSGQTVLAEGDARPLSRPFGGVHGLVHMAYAPAAPGGNGLPPSGNVLPELGEGGRPIEPLWRDLSFGAMSLRSELSELSGLSGLGGTAVRREAPPLDLAFLAGGVSSTEAGRGATQSAWPSPVTAPQTPAQPQAQLEQGLAQRLTWMIHQGVREAHVRVEPEALGPILIRVRLEREAVQVSFHSAHAPVREALVEAVPRLRELLADGGMILSDVDVEAHAGGEGRDQERSDGTDAGFGALDAVEPTDRHQDSDMRRPARTIHGLLDTYA